MGLASYYGQQFHGKATASGVPFDMHAMVAAHPTYPFGTLVRVTNLQNRRSVRVRRCSAGGPPESSIDGPGSACYKPHSYPTCDVAHPHRRNVTARFPLI